MIRSLVDRELDYLWSRLAWAARGRGEQIGALWSRDGDPRVSRLVQSAAYAFARVKEKLEDELPEISHPLVAAALPEVLRPTPSATVVQVQDARRARKVPTMFEPQLLESRRIDGAPCLFGTCWPVLASPLDLHSEIRTDGAGDMTLRLRLARYSHPSLRSSLPSVLRVFIKSEGGRSLDVVRAVAHTKKPVQIRMLDGGGHSIAEREAPSLAPLPTALGPVTFLPGARDRFPSSSALRAFFAFPELFAFFDLDLEALRNVIPENAAALELGVQLDGRLDDAAASATCHLNCAPAVNVFETRTVPVPIRALGPCGALRVSGHPGREIFAIHRAQLAFDGLPDSLAAVRLWESHRGTAYLDDELHLRLERRAPNGTGALEMRGILGRSHGLTAIPFGELRCDVLATDGIRPDALLEGEVGTWSDSLQATNISRVSPSRRAALDQWLPWRLSAYARMPIPQLAQAGSLAAFLDVHDVTGKRRRPENGGNSGRAGVLFATHSMVKRVSGDEVLLGDQVDFALDDAVFGGVGATWLIGELLARAMAERCDLLRYTRARLVSPRGDLRFDYGIREGERLPAPFG
jgi:type VI secretion system protein ImpG